MVHSFLLLDSNLCHGEEEAGSSLETSAFPPPPVCLINSWNSAMAWDRDAKLSEGRAVSKERKKSTNYKGEAEQICGWRETAAIPKQKWEEQCGCGSHEADGHGGERSHKTTLDSYRLETQIIPSRPKPAM